MTDPRKALPAALLLTMAMLVCDAALAQKTRLGPLQGGNGGVLLQRSTPAPTGSALSVEEVEPNNTAAEAQVLQDASPVTLNGNAELADEGDLFITFQEGTDDFEDLFVIETTAPGLLQLNLDGLASDCDLYLINEEANTALAASFNIGLDPEVIEMPELEAGTYIIAVTIFDPIPGGPDSTSYVLTVTGAVSTATEAETDLPGAFTLAQNYPNPFNPETRIVYTLPAPASVQLDVFDVLGHRVRTLVAAERPSGTHVATWDGRTDGGVQAATGVYVYRLRAGAFAQSRRMVLLR